MTLCNVEKDHGGSPWNLIIIPWGYPMAFDRKTMVVSNGITVKDHGDNPWQDVRV